MKKCLSISDFIQVDKVDNALTKSPAFISSCVLNYIKLCIGKNAIADVFLLIWNL